MHVITELGRLLNPFLFVLIGPFSDPPTFRPFRRPFLFILLGMCCFIHLGPGYCTRDTSFLYPSLCLALSVAVLGSNNFSASFITMFPVPG